MRDSIRIASIVGARPQFIKAAVISRSISRYNQRLQCKIDELIVHTGQHYDDNMSRVFFNELDIPRPDYDLEVGSSSHGRQTGLMLQRIEGVLEEQRPDFVVVYGDTNSTLAGSLAATKLHIPVAHVEAGLRSFNRKMAEEINRIVADHVADILFCPTKLAVENLANEGVKRGVHQVGDVMYDSMLYYSKMAESLEDNVLKKLGVEKGSYYLATIHRAENTDDRNRLWQIIEGLNAVSENHPVILPLHPRTIGFVDKYELKFSKRVFVIEPVSYLEMAAIEKNARLILTDSGGVQKEAYFLGVSCVTLRNETEWSELIDSGWNRLAGADRESIVKSATEAEKLNEVGKESFYGDGNAGDKIIDILTG
ncbi:MAG: UDP-N-acetylglucosamine 2-epimerase (non-hydrolyzing) [Desulfobacterales bacterium]